ncbi:MAG: type II toxin-antitoxin system PemK/MazF family toxin [Spirochaetes bacterium]|nr:type II toxin-antitoxin system PemK/MazF family toxin [Spirochaetota bacterium]
MILLNFPFSDNINVKKRPAKVLFDTGDNDIVLARITSQQTKTKYDVNIKNWKKSGLLQESNVRLHKIATLEKQLIYKKMGILQSEDLKNVKSIIKQLRNI